MSIRTLYLCYFGLREPLVQTQVLPYLRYLAAAGIKVHLLTFEARLRKEWSEEELTKQKARLATEGISWHFLPYHKRPSVPATVYDILAGARFAVQLAKREGLDVLHARAHVPMAMALLARRFLRCQLVFDFRGLMADEYVDAGIWTDRSMAFRAVKMIERAGLRQANQVIVLTQRMRDWLVEHQVKNADQIEVIPCCVDLTRFDVNGIETGASAGADCFEVVYAGSLIGLYLVEEMGRFFKAVKAQRPHAFLRILSVSPPEHGMAALKRAGLDQKDFKIEASSPLDVPAVLRRASLGVSFRKPTFAQIAASPTKIPEYLAAGLPVVSNHGIGDTDELLTSERVGIIVRDFDNDSLARAATAALTLADEPGIAARCREVAHKHFELASIGGARYVKGYQRLERQAAEF